MKTLNMRELLVGRPSRLRYVWRFSSFRVSHQESVAEHCYFTALYALFIADWVVCEKGLSIFMGKLLAKCLLHDMEEAMTGDIPRGFKYSDPDVLAALRMASKTAFQQAVADVVPEDLHHYTDVWDKAKDDSIEGRIVQVADFLSAVSYLLQEAADHDRTMREHMLSVREYYSRFRGTEFDFVRPLLEQAWPLVEECDGVQGG